MDPRKTVPLFLMLALVIAMSPIQGIQAGDHAFPMGTCEDCHDDFAPFTVQAIAPKEIKEGEKADFKVRVTNTGRHSCEDLVARLSGPGFNQSGPQTTSMSGGVTRGNSISTDFDVDLGATGISVVMDERPPPPFFADLSLTVTAPDGHQEQSNSGTTSESVEFSESLIKRAGPGSYTVTVVHETGIRASSFDMVALIEYPDLTRMAGIGSLPPGAQADVSWELEVTEEIAQDLTVLVTGNVSYDHDGELRADQYTIEQPFKVGKLTRDRPVETTEIPKSIRWPIRYALAVLLSISVILGVPTIRKRIFKDVKAAKLRWWHCAISWTMVPLFIVHALLATTRHPWTSPPAVTGMVVATIITLLALTGTFRDKLRERMGAPMWRRMHQVQTIAAIVMLAIHWVL